VAIVRSVRTGPPSSSLHPTEVDLEVKRVTSPDGVALVQLTTFGSDHRLSDPKPSQTIQLDATHAQALIQEMTRALALPLREI
jgi:hypothetical protein